MQQIHTAGQLNSGDSAGREPIQCQTGTRDFSRSRPRQCESTGGAAGRR
nr:hypothetical protein [Leptolyngbya sp. 7M]